MAVNRVDLRNSDGSINTIIDLTSDTVTEDTLAEGIVAHGSDGSRIVGRMSAGSGLDTSDATATASDIAKGKTAYVNGELVTGKVEEDTISYSGYYTSLEFGVDVDGTKNFWPRKTVNSDVLLRTGAKIGILVPFSEFGTATVNDVAKGVTFTSVDGRQLEGNVQVVDYDGDSSYHSVFQNTNVMGSTLNGSKYIELVEYNPTSVLVRANARLSSVFLASEFGNATAEDVTAGKTFTGADGFKVVGTKEEPTYSETTGYIDRKQGNPPSSATSQTFTEMKGEPNWFVYTIAASSLPTASGYTRCVNIIYDGTNLVGSALGTLGTYSTSYFTKSYNGASLTVGTTGSSTGGYVHNSSASEGYRLLYGYGGAHINKRYVVKGGNSVVFAGIDKKPDWFCIYAIQDYGASVDAVVDVVYDGKNIYGNYASSNSVKYATDFTYAYSGTTLTINSNSASSFNLTDDGYCLIYGYANESEDSGSGDSGGGSSSSNFYSGTFTGTGTKATQVEIDCGFQPTGFTIVSNATMSAANNISMVSVTTVGSKKYTGCVGYRGSYGSTITTSAFVNANIPTSQVTVTFGTNSLTIKPGNNYAFQASTYTVHAWK